MKGLDPKYYIYFKDKKGVCGFLVFKSKEQMNLYLLMHGSKYEYMHIISGFTLEERRNK